MYKVHKKRQKRGKVHRNVAVRAQNVAVRATKCCCPRIVQACLHDVFCEAEYAAIKPNFEIKFSKLGLVTAHLRTATKLTPAYLACGTNGNFPPTPI